MGSLDSLSRLLRPWEVEAVTSRSRGLLIVRFADNPGRKKIIEQCHIGGIGHKDFLGGILLLVIFPGLLSWVGTTERASAYCFPECRFWATNHFSCGQPQVAQVERPRAHGLHVYLIIEWDAIEQRVGIIRVSAPPSDRRAWRVAPERSRRRPIPVQARSPRSQRSLGRRSARRRAGSR
jgi:hypothetical protein